jgi:hypothetical protein
MGLTGLAVAGSVVTSPMASADPSCPKNLTVKVQDKLLPSPGNQVCDEDNNRGRGLLGNAPLVGNLPGLGGIL